ncbi:MAG: hypothetical protein J5612_01985 [Paludibacteraceae bacterium]|nr:hypothetical protein [Paludibacteraceae bacterium]
MTYQTRVILRRTLPVVFWLLAVGGVISVPFIIGWDTPSNYWWGFIVTALVLCCVLILERIDRHVSSAKENFQTAVLLGVASYWLPTVVFLTIPFWIYIIYKNAFNFRAILATLIGYMLVAIHAAILIWFEWIDCVWAAFLAPERLWGWIPVGAVLVAWLASTIVRQSLRER